MALGLKLSVRQQKSLEARRGVTRRTEALFWTLWSGYSVLRRERLPFEVTLPEQTITRAEAKNAFHELREQAADIPEMSLDEINAEISAVRMERKR